MKLQVTFASGKRLISRELTVEQVQQARTLLTTLADNRMVAFPEQARQVLVNPAQIDFISVATDDAVPTDIDNPRLPEPRPTDGE